MTDINIDLGPTTTEEVRRVWLADDGRQTTHWEGCWRVHPACCIGMLVRQVEEDAWGAYEMRELVEYLWEKVDEQEWDRVDEEGE